MHKMRGVGSTLSVHIEKHKKGAVNGLQRHNERKPGQKHSNEFIDDARTADNIALARWGEGGSYQARIQDILDKHYEGKRAPRSDAVVMVEVSVNLGGVITELSEREQVEVLEFMHEWLSERYGYVVSSNIHVDEMTPHLQFDLVPLTADGRLSAKEVFNRGALQALQRESLEAVQEAFPSYGFKRLSEDEKLFSSGLEYEAYKKLLEASKDLSERESAIEGREGSVSAREAVVASKDAELGERISSYNEKVKSNNEKLNKVQDELRKRGQTVVQREQSLTTREALLEKRERLYASREERLATREASLSSSEAHMALLRAQLDKEAKAQEKLAEELSEASEKLSERVKHLDKVRHLFVSAVERFKGDYERMWNLNALVEANQPVEENVDEFIAGLKELGVDESSLSR